jgi:hypothetical protein
MPLFICNIIKVANCRKIAGIDYPCPAIKLLVMLVTAGIYYSHNPATAFGFFPKRRGIYHLDIPGYALWLG